MPLKSLSRAAGLKEMVGAVGGIEMNVCSGHVNVVKWQYCTRTTCWAIIRINIAVKVMVRLFAKTRAKWLNRKLLWWILVDICSLIWDVRGGCYGVAVPGLLALPG